MPSLEDRRLAAKNSIPSKSSWQHDDDKIELYFHACHENYKAWMGDAPQQLKLKLYAVYKQALVGDCREERPFDSFKKKKWEMWKVFAGMEKCAAMRRYITLLVQLDPQLVVVEVQEKPPPMFPTTPMGEPICARANCLAGCVSPLISRGARKPKYEGEHMPNGGHDPDAGPLEEQLLSDPSLLSYEGLKSWMVEEGEQVRCKFGTHSPVTPDQVKPFHQWFGHVSCGGFLAYDKDKDKTLAKLVEGLLSRAFLRAYAMQIAPKDYRYEERVTHVQSCLQARKAFYDVTSKFFSLQVECQRFDVAHCNAKRQADGFKNHKHSLELTFPEPDYGDYGAASGLRKELNRLGVDPTTRVVGSLEEREDILAARLAKHHQIQFTVSEAQRRQRARRFYAPIQHQRMLSSGALKTAKQLQGAIKRNDAELCVALVRKGAPPDAESAGGLTAVLRATLNGDRSFLRMLHEAGADVNVFSQRTGLSALCWACRRGDLPTVLSLLALPDIVVSGEGPSGWTPLLSASAAGKTKCCDALLGWVKEHSAGGDETAKEVSRLVNFQNKANGDTALHVASRARQLPMCMHLLQSGSNKYTRNAEGRDAASLAADCGFKDLSTWLEGTRLGAEVGHCPKLDVLLELKEKKDAEVAAAEKKKRESMPGKSADGPGSGVASGVASGLLQSVKKGLGVSREQSTSERLKKQEEGDARQHAAVVEKAKLQFEAKLKLESEAADGEAMERAEEAAALMVVALRLGLRRGQGGGDELLARHRNARSGAVTFSTFDASNFSGAKEGSMRVVSSSMREGQSMREGGGGPGGESSGGGAMRTRDRGGGVNRNASLARITSIKEGGASNRGKANTTSSNRGKILSASQSQTSFRGGGGACGGRKLGASRGALGASIMERGFAEDDEDEDEGGDGDGDGGNSQDGKAAQQAIRYATANFKSMDSICSSEGGGDSFVDSFAEFGGSFGSNFNNGSESEVGQSFAARSAEKTEKRNAQGRAFLLRLANGEDPLSGGHDEFESQEHKLLVAVDLIEHDGCPPNFETPEGATALLVASFDGDAHGVRRLVAQGCDVNYQNRNGRTPLMAAAAGGSISVAMELLRAGAGILDVDLEGKCAGQFAFEAAMEPLAKLLAASAKVGIEETLELLKAAKGDTALDKLLVSYGVTAGEAGGPDDPSGDSYLWRLPNGGGGGGGGGSSAEGHSGGSSKGSSSLQPVSTFSSPLPSVSAKGFASAMNSFDTDDLSACGGKADRVGYASLPSQASTTNLVPMATFSSSSSASSSVATSGEEERKTAAVLALGNGSIDETLQRSAQQGGSNDLLATLQTKNKRAPSKEEELRHDAAVREELKEIQNIRRQVQLQGKRRMAARPNSQERRFLARIKDASTLKNVKKVKDESKAAAARKKLKDSSSLALEQVQELARLVSKHSAIKHQHHGQGGSGQSQGGKQKGGAGAGADATANGKKRVSLLSLETVEEADAAAAGGHVDHSAEAPPPPPIVGDGIEQWKDRMDEVKRKWIQGDVLTADVVASRKHPDFFVKPAEMELASFLIGQRKFQEAEVLLLQTMDLQKRAELRETSLAGGKFAVGLCLRGLADVFESRGQIAKALEHREESLALIATALEATHAEVRVAVDLVAGTHMLARDWSLAVELYQAVATEMQSSPFEARRSVAATMEERAAAVSLVRDRADMTANDSLSLKAEMLFRHPDLREAMRIGKTPEFLEALLCEVSLVCESGRKSFKQHTKRKGGALPTLLAFFTEVQKFRTLEGGSDHPVFVVSLKHLNKKFIKPPSKLPMLTQGIRADIANDMSSPSISMFDAAQKLVLNTLFAASFGGGDAWIASQEGNLWKRARDVELNPAAKRGIESLQILVRYLTKRKADRERRLGNDQQPTKKKKRKSHHRNRIMSGEERGRITSRTLAEKAATQPLPLLK